MRGRSILRSRIEEISMASLIFGFIASMGTIMLVMMVLLNSYLQRYSPTAAQQPPTVIGPNAASPHQTGRLGTTYGLTDGSSSSEAARTLASDAAVSRDPESTPAPVKDSDNAQTSATAETAQTITDNGEMPIPAPAEVKNVTPQKSANHHKVSRHRAKSRRSALRSKSQAPYGYGSFSGDGTRF